MTVNKDIRELQLTSLQMILLVIGVLAVSIFIFVLGVTVGKKHVQIKAQAKIPAVTSTEQVKAKPTPSLSEPAKSRIQEEVASHDKAIREETGKKAPTTPAPAAKKAALPANVYYIQVGAFTDKKSAQSASENFKKSGFSILVLDPLPSDKTPYFRVRIGSFPTREEALKVKARLSAEFKKTDYFVVKD
jgi:cell division protein FtsN